MKKADVKWQHIRMLLRAITNENGIVIKDGRDIAHAMELPNYSKLSYIIKVKDKIFNGNSDPHINEISKKFHQKYMTFDFQKARSKKNFVDKLCDEINKKHSQMIQQKIEFKEPHPINNILGLSAEHTIETINQSQLFYINKRLNQIEKEIEILKKENHSLNRKIDHVNGVITRNTKIVDDFIQSWTNRGIYNSVN